MATGKPGADSASIVTTQQQGQNLIQLSTQLFNQPPVFWGRYFTSSSTSGVEYCHRKENDILRRNGIRVCPVARQTKHVNGSRDQGAADARANAEDLVNTFGAAYLAAQGGSFYLFLDVESAPSLSLDYYLGWAITISTHSADLTSGAVRILPCVYATQSDTTTWQAIAAAAAQGVACHGAWVARWRNDGAFDLQPWNDDKITPMVTLPCKVLIWQYASDCHGAGGFDCDQTNPSLDLRTELLDRLILPPAGPM